MDYDLWRLNSRSFEQLIQLLAAKVLGQGVIPFGDGPDGGREGEITARVPYPSETDSWNGRIVLQAKFRQRTQGTTIDGRWAVDQLRQELKRYEEGSASKVADHLIFATNVTLSPVEDSGAKDRMFALANDAIARGREARQRGEQNGLLGFDVWDYDKLRMYLDQFEDVRRSFGAYVLPGDVLAETVATLEGIRNSAPSFDDSMSLFLQKELLAEQWVNLDQAGTTLEEQVPVSRVFVNLPVFPVRQADPPGESADALIPGFVANVVEVSSRRHDQRTLQMEGYPSDGRIVLLGGPGQGKSTIGQFICQMFRVALLKSRPKGSVSAEVDHVLEMVEDHCEADQLTLPSTRRFPLRVVLSEFAKELARPDGAKSLLEYLANRITSLIPGEVSASLMSTWLSEYPWLLVLDGLDEVPASSNRDEVMAAIENFWVDVSQSNTDCVVIATTRPQGYAHEFASRLYRHAWLAPISTARALHYAKRLLTVRFPHDTGRQATIAARLNDAASNPETARLMTSPLQVTIMAALLDRMGKPLPGRWNLFSQYYRVIYERESEKEIPAASVLRNYKRDVNVIHQRVGLLLQVESETAEQAEVRMSRERFSEVVVARLKEEGHESETARKLANELIEAAMHRLVFLVGLQDDQVGFELRSLQEFMAAEALLDAKETIVEERLRLIAPLPIWRNVFLFAAGRCFSDLEQYRDTIHTICIELDDAESQPLAPIAMSGATLAIDLLADGVVERRPRYQRLLAREALRILRRPPGELHDQLAEIYTSSLRTTFEEELKAALASSPFVATLGAWRTLAVMGARSVDWVWPLLEEHLPESDNLGHLLQALQPSARSRWLSERLAALCVKAPPVQSLPHAERLRELNVFAFTPFWYQAAGDPGKEFRRSVTSVAIRGRGSSGMSVVVHSASGDDWLTGATHPVTRKEAPVSWQPLLTALRFASSPSAEALSTALVDMYEAGDFEAVRRCASVAPWPLASVLQTVSDREDLKVLAELARDNRMGDITQWHDAERRWRNGIVGEDLAYPPDGKLPYNAMIGSKGFPFTAGISFRPTDSRRIATEDLLGWLGEMTHLPSRRLAASIVFDLLEPLDEEPLDEPVSAADLAAVLHEEDLADCRTLRLRALNKVRWGTSLSSRELGLLNALGDLFSQAASAAESPLLSSHLRELLMSAWIENPELDGLYRMLAIGWPADGTDRESAQPLLDRAPGVRTEAAHTLLQLKLAEPDCQREVPLEPLVKAEEIWMTSAIQVLARWNEAAAAVTVRLDGVLAAERWMQKSALDAIGRGLVGRSPSGLTNIEKWASLELFERPPWPQEEAGE